jgi:superfamily II DNA or RNA helicase
MELMRLSAFDREARRALLARYRLINLLADAENKLVTLAKLLREHSHESVVIFTENNDVVYQISRQYLIPALTHETDLLHTRWNG